jgi:type I restriction enzyme R subunit
MTEDQLEQETLAWLIDVGYTHVYGPDIAHDGPAPERVRLVRLVTPDGQIRVVATNLPAQDFPA